MVLWWWACATPEDPVETCPNAASPALSLGVIGDTFVPLASGDEITLEHGPQGGTHLTLAVEVAAEDLDAVPLVLAVDALVVGDSCPEGCLVGEVTFALDPAYASATTPEGWRFEGVRVVVSAWPTDQIRRLALTVTDACGRTDDLSFDFEPLSGAS